MPDTYRTQQLTPELYCRSIHVSLKFYTDVLGFNILYQREEEGFAMLDYQGAHLMLDQLHKTAPADTGRTWLTAPLEYPFGRGINLQIMSNEVDALYERVQKARASIFLPIEEKWYRSNNVELGNRQFIVLDPDGYMLRFAQDLGQRPCTITHILD